MESENNFFYFFFDGRSIIICDCKDWMIVRYDLNIFTELGEIINCFVW